MVANCFRLLTGLPLNARTYSCNTKADGAIQKGQIIMHSQKQRMLNVLVHVLVKHITHIITDNVDKVGKLSTDDDI
jgi:hypothetical protein